MIGTDSPTAAQSAISQRIADQAERMVESFDPSMEPSECFVKIAGGVGYDGESSTCAPFGEKHLSLSRVAEEPRSLASLLGPTGILEVQRFCSSSVVQIEGGIEEARRRTGLTRPYMDPGLRSSPRKYRSLIKRLYDVHMLDVTVDDAECEIGLFAVPKKNLEQRLIADCRLSNVFFGEPEYTELPTCASGVDEEMCVSQFDLNNACFQLALPVESRK